MAGEAAQPETKYAQVGPDRLAYQVLGQEPPDLVFTMDAFKHVDLVWDDPQMALFLRRLASFSRRVALLATGPQAGPMALFFAGTRPERTSALCSASTTT